MSAMQPVVPFIDLAIARESVEHKEILSAISVVLETGQFICGAQVQSLERTLADYCGCTYAVALNSGTDALFFALKSIGIGTGDEVVLPANVFWAVANSVKNCGAIPVFADVDKNDMLLSAETIQPRITSKTKAIICVHLTGMPCRMDAINKLAERFNITVIEDAAQALGAVYHGRNVGSLGKIGCFSFHPLKNIACLGDGGALVTDDQDVYRQCLQLRNHGLEEQSCQEVVGFNSRLDEIQAAVLLIRLTRIESVIAAKRKIAALYKTMLPDACRIMEEGDDRLGVYQLFMIQCENRDELRIFLLNKGIQTAVHYRQYQHKQKPYLHYNRAHLVVTEQLGKKVLSLPIRKDMTEEEVFFVCQSIKEFYK
jgi:dTDP-4-amino-4,6-dideoxygalactose transaminase